MRFLISVLKRFLPVLLLFLESNNIDCDFAIDLLVTLYSAAVTLVFSERTDVGSKRREVF